MKYLKKISENQNNSEYDFYKITYSDKYVIAAYMVTHLSKASITVLNIQEVVDAEIFTLSGNKTFHIVPNLVNLPTSQITIISNVFGMPGFKWIKIPYWLYKRNDGLEIKRYDGVKLLRIQKYQMNSRFLDMICDEDVINYFNIVYSKSEIMDLDSMRIRLKNHLKK